MFFVQSSALVGSVVQWFNHVQPMSPEAANAYGYLASDTAAKFFELRLVVTQNM
jgi:hypothetical protein